MPRHGWGGFEPPRERPFGRGDLKYVLLDLIEERPRHGYDLIQALSERFMGRYAASPGTVYPGLQMLEDMGLATVESLDGRKTYSVTEAGRAYLREHREHLQGIWRRAGAHHSGGRSADPEAWRAIFQEMKRLGGLFREAATRGDAERLQRVLAILVEAARQIEAVLAEPER